VAFAAEIPCSAQPLACIGGALGYAGSMRNKG
jgi:hypothetical protein